MVQRPLVLNGTIIYRTTMKQGAMSLSDQIRQRRPTLGLVELSSQPVPDGTVPTALQTVSKIRRLFWDHPLTIKDLTEHTVWVVERVLEYGTIEDIRVMHRFMGKDVFLRAVAATNRLSPRTRNFWRNILESEGIPPCTKMFCRNTAWNS